jgi:hypothetical protein
MKICIYTKAALNIAVRPVLFLSNSERIRAAEHYPSQRFPVRLIRLPLQVNGGEHAVRGLPRHVSEPCK